MTLINKEHGSGAHVAKVAIEAPGFSNSATVMVLTAPNGDCSAKTGMSLGGASISAEHPWLGNWEPLTPAQPGRYELEVAAASAAIVRIPRR